MDIYYYLLILFTFFSVLYLLFDDKKKKVPPISLFLAVILSGFTIYTLAYYPIVRGDDKSNYLRLFQTINFQKIFLSKDIGYNFYVYINRTLYDNAQLFFLITAFFYIGGYWVFGLKTFKKQYFYAFILMTFSSFAFTAYGVNTLRAGLALSILLIAFANHKKTVLFFVFALIAVSFHKSIAIPFFFFVLTHYWNSTRVFIYIWASALALSFFNISSLSAFLQENIFSFDDRAATYFDTAKTHYKIGFRLDFVIYSFIPILIGGYYIFKLKLEDVLYRRLYGVYILTNAIWLLVIRMAFTDRVAYLSWFLIPFLILYPLLKYDLPLNQRKWIACALVISITFTSFMYFK